MIDWEEEYPMVRWGGFQFQPELHYTTRWEKVPPEPAPVPTTVEGR